MTEPKFAIGGVPAPEMAEQSDDNPTLSANFLAYYIDRIRHNFLQ